MDRFNNWQNLPPLAYDPNGFIAGLDPTYIQVTDQAPTIQEPTYSQRCLQLLPEEIREAYTIAYEAIKRSIGEHQRPNWDLIWLDAVISPPHLVKEALKAHFDKLFQDAGKLSSSTTTTSSIPSIFHPQGGQQISAPPTHRPSTSSTSSSISNPLSTPNQTVSPTSNETTSSRSVVPLGPSKAANDPPNQPQPGSTVSMSKAALQAISSKGTWKGWHYCGVVRWLQGTSDTEPLSDNEILEHSRKVVKKLRGSRGNGTAKGKKERKQTTRAEDYPNLRERWRPTLLCCTLTRISITSPPSHPLPTHHHTLLLLTRKESIHALYDHTPNKPHPPHPPAQPWVCSDTLQTISTPIVTFEAKEDDDGTVHWLLRLSDALDSRHGSQHNRVDETLILGRTSRLSDGQGRPDGEFDAFITSRQPHISALPNPSGSSNSPNPLSPSRSSGLLPLSDLSSPTPRHHPDLSLPSSDIFSPSVTLVVTPPPVRPLKLLLDCSLLISERLPRECNYHYHHAPSHQTLYQTKTGRKQWMWY
ncbi:hypothetical protein CF326_g967 [Tilletia indica]|nr:hypothetical protein CF326_g967 [Tilletia indica]